MAAAFCTEREQRIRFEARHAKNRPASRGKIMRGTFRICVRAETQLYNIYDFLVEKKKKNRISLKPKNCPLESNQSFKKYLKSNFAFCIRW